MRAMAADSTTEALVSPPPKGVSAPKLYGEDSDHDGVVRIFVRHSYHWNELIILFTQHNFFPYQECN